MTSFPAQVGVYLRKEINLTRDARSTGGGNTPACHLKKLLFINKYCNADLENTNEHPGRGTLCKCK